MTYFVSGEMQNLNSINVNLSIKMTRDQNAFTLTPKVHKTW